jgi:transcriptional regulator with GAF, ATPase, and Fis domain
MTVHLEITDGAGARQVTVEQPSFWLGARRSGCEVELNLPGCAGRIVEVRVEESGRLRVRAEPGLPFPVRSVNGTVGARFEGLLDGDVLNVGPAMVKLRHVPEATASGIEEIDPGALAGGDSRPGTPIGAWYQTFMEVADTLEGLTEAGRMIQTAMDAILGSTAAERVMIEVDDEHAIDGETSFHLTAGGSRGRFRVSRSLVEQVKDSGRVVHVPVASADPVASQFTSVRREGISSSIALPLRALGKTLGVLYADCVREGQTLAAADLQRVAFIGRLLAGALGNRDLVARLVRAAPAEEAMMPALQTRSPRYAEVVERIRLYAPTDYTVLIRGETGTGKEVVARALHDLSRRRKGPFVPVNCAAIPEALMESMLFGHEKGAFTGATQSRRGHFEEAHGGTLFLDEIGDMASDLQAKILRVLQDRIVVPVGGRRQTRVDVRILAATHQDLEKLGKEGRFREDLYFRLRELEIALPPLRERPEDLVELCASFLAEAARELHLSAVPDLTEPTLQHLRRLPWRGNIRELRHMIKGAALRAAGGPIRIEHLDASGAPPRPAAEPVLLPANEPDRTWKERLEAQEREALRATLEEANGNLTRGAELFGVPRTTYREKLVKHGLLRSDA